MKQNRIVYVNGAFVDERDACVSVFDRGFLFADAVYEVSSVLQGRLVDNSAHLARLRRSLAALHMPALDEAALVEVQQQIIARNALQEGIVYVQISRGTVWERSFALPVEPTLGMVVFSQTANLLSNPLAERGIRVISVEDIRWQQCDIKTVMLLPASLAKYQAQQAGADDAWFVTDGWVKEGTANNAFIITRDGKIVTRPLDNLILHGITRAAVLRLAYESGLAFEERPFRLDEVYEAQEAFSTGASAFVLPVVSMNGRAIGSGQVGAFASRLRTLYIEHVLASM